MGKNKLEEKELKEVKTEEIEKEEIKEDIKEEKKDDKKNDKKDEKEIKNNKEEKKQQEDKKVKEDSSKENEISKKEEKKDNKTKEKIDSRKEEFSIVEKEDVDIKTNNLKIIIPLIIGGILLIALIFSTIFSILNINNNNIISGVKIQGIEVSGLSQEQAKAKIEEIFNEKKQKDIILKYQDYETTITPEIIETEYDIDKAVLEAVSLGKNNNIFINNYNILFTLILKRNINLDISVNEETLKQKITEIGLEIPGAVKEPSYVVEEDKLIITKGKEGLKVNEEELIENVKSSLLNANINQEVIEIPVYSKIPEEIDIEKIHEEVYQEVKDAYYTKEPFEIHPEVEGRDFDIEEAKKILEEDKETYEIPLKITKPKVTTAQIGSEAFPDLLATFSTRYDGGQVDRTTNLKIACSKISDKVIMPDEVFSYNKALGARTQATGYKNAKVYENGEVVDGIGGGICQISSTLYNSVLMANMEVVERRNHQFVTSYLPAGRDATVVYGVTDFKFKNTRKYPVRIKASCSNGIATVSIYGIKEETDCIVSFSTKTISTLPFTVKYVDDPSLAPGQESVKQKGANGLVTETYITKTQNGRVVSSKLLSKDTYTPMQKIILRGVGTAPSTPQQPASTQQQTQPTQQQTQPSNNSNNQQNQNSQHNTTPSQSDPPSSGDEGDEGTGNGE